ncbi:MAG: hypothetical protein HY901_16680 [Deltaproteobacteria bacterium]|nr:hypothetical protein [Deltaproteobacteria bacterium]
MFARTFELALVVSATALLPAAAFGQQYVGSEKCKTCHNAKDKGEMYTKWKATQHAKAFETLGSEAAKKLNKGADAQKEGKCLKCHNTEAAVPADKLAKSFKKDQGVGCESCHGPGDKHVKARMASEDDSTVTDAEVVRAPGEKTCLTCHNKESPTFKGFKFAEAAKKIEHKNPSKKSQ